MSDDELGLNSLETSELIEQIHDDLYCRDAAVAAETAQALIQVRRLTSGED